MFFKRISIRIGLWYALFFALSACVLFAVTSYLLISMLALKDRELLENKAREFASLYKHRGVEGLRARVDRNADQSGASYVLRLVDSEGKTLLFHVPTSIEEDEEAPHSAEIVAFLAKSNGKTRPLELESGDIGDNIEFSSNVLPSGDTLQVGKDTEDREDFLKAFARAYFFAFFPVMGISILVGVYFSGRMLRPIRWLTDTVAEISSGDSHARVVVRGNGDELDQLGEHFNRMVHQNELLVAGMRETVDNVAHDLRTPIMRLRSSAEEALSSDGNDIEIYRKALLDAQENSSGILSLLDGIMDISEASAGTLELRKEKCRMSDLVAKAYDLYSYVAEERNIEVSIDTQSDFECDADPVRLLQAISNLLDNAIKYSPSGSRVKFVVRREGSIGVMEIEDEGDGISERDGDKIWERLYRGDTSRTSRGQGLGLSLVKAIVIAHGGTVGVRSASERGSVFFLRIPCAQSVEDK